MARLNWDQRPYAFGIDQGVVSIHNGPTLPWNGLVSVKYDDKATLINRYFEGLPLPLRIRPTDTSGSITAYSIPNELIETRNQGLVTKRKRPTFDFCYREMTNDGYRLHIFYNVKIAPGESVFLKDEPTGFDLSFMTRPVSIEKFEPSAHFILDTNAMDPYVRLEVESRIFGDINFDHKIPSMETIISFIPVTDFIVVTDLGDGLFTIEAPDHILSMVDADTFTIDHPAVRLLENDLYSVESV